MLPPVLLFLLAVSATSDAASLNLTEVVSRRINGWLVSIAAGANRLGSAVSGGLYGGLQLFVSAASAPPSYATTSFVGGRGRRSVRVSGGQLSSGLSTGSVSVGLALGGSAAEGEDLQGLGSTAAVAPGVATSVSLGRLLRGRGGSATAGAGAAKSGPATATVLRCSDAHGTCRD